MIELAIFDMDHTVMSIDCDHSWKYFLVEEGLASPANRDEADRFLDLYHQGHTPINEFIEFQLNEFAGQSIAEIRTIADKHFKQQVRKHVFSQARNEIDKFNYNKIDTILLTGTNRIIAEPIAKSLGVCKLIATEPHIKDGYFTGRVYGPVLMKQAKLKSAKDICLKMNIDLNKVTYFADSITDVPLLLEVGYPVVVNPKSDLLLFAKTNKWQIKNWFNDVNFLAQPKKTNFRL